MSLASPPHPSLILSLGTRERLGQSERRHRCRAQRRAAGRDPVPACALCRLRVHRGHLPQRRGNRPAQSCFAVQWGEETPNPCKAKKVVET